jgi:hypothetical protein
VVVKMRRVDTAVRIEKSAGGLPEVTGQKVGPILAQQSKALFCHHIHRCSDDRDEDSRLILDRIPESSG